MAEKEANHCKDFALLLTAAYVFFRKLGFIISRPDIQKKLAKKGYVLPPLSNIYMYVYERGVSTVKGRNILYNLMS